MNRLVKKPIEMRFVRLPGRSARTDWVLRSEQRCSAAPRYLMEVHPVPKLAPRPTRLGVLAVLSCRGGNGSDADGDVPRSRVPNCLLLLDR